MLITFRKPEMRDMAAMFAWQQHPITKVFNPRHVPPAWEQYLATMFKASNDPEEMLQVMAIDEHIVGFIVFREHEHGVWFGIRVAPGLSGRGFEASMVEHAKQRWGSKLATTVNSEQEAESYASLGFEQEGETNVWRYRG